MSANDEDKQGNTIQLDQMSLEQLDQLKQREESRMQVLSARYAQLRQAAARLAASNTAVVELGECIKSLSSQQIKHCDVFIPLTESVYVPGKINLENSKNDELMVELGTGYFVEKSQEDTIDFLNRKLRLVDVNSNNVTTALQSSKFNLEQISMAMQGKLIEIRARQEAQRHRSAADR